MKRKSWLHYILSLNGHFLSRSYRFNRLQLLFFLQDTKQLLERIIDFQSRRPREAKCTNQVKGAVMLPKSPTVNHLLMTVSSKTSKRETNDKLSYDAYGLSLTLFLAAIESPPCTISIIITIKSVFCLLGTLILSLLLSLSLSYERRSSQLCTQL